MAHRSGAGRSVSVREESIRLCLFEIQYDWNDVVAGALEWVHRLMVTRVKRVCDRSLVLVAGDGVLLVRGGQVPILGSVAFGMDEQLLFAGFLLGGNRVLLSISDRGHEPPRRVRRALHIVALSKFCLVDYLVLLILLQIKIWYNYFVCVVLLIDPWDARAAFSFFENAAACGGCWREYVCVQNFCIGGSLLLRSNTPSPLAVPRRLFHVIVLFAEDVLDFAVGASRFGLGLLFALDFSNTELIFWLLLV